MASLEQPIGRREPAPDSAPQGRDDRSIEDSIPEDLEEKLSDVLERVPQGQRQEIERIVHAVAAYYQGPLPPPSMLNGYEATLPGAADRIMKMAEAEQAHRHHWETQVLGNDQRYATLGLSAGWCVAVLLAVAAAVVGVAGDWRVGVALAAASATGMVARLVQGRSRSGERKAPGRAEPPVGASSSDPAD